jgi:hypothetical protein
VTLQQCKDVHHLSVNTLYIDSCIQMPGMHDHRSALPVRPHARAVLSAGENGILNQPGCDVRTGGAVVLLLVPESSKLATAALQDHLANTVGTSSAAALTRRLSETVLEVQTAQQVAAAACPHDNVDGGYVDAGDDAADDRDATGRGADSEEEKGGGRRDDNAGVPADGHVEVPMDAVAEYSFDTEGLRGDL